MQSQRPVSWTYDPAMLTSVLPGLREVRTPLTAGVIWLIVAWLAVAPQLPETPPSCRAFLATSTVGATSRVVL